VHGHGIARQPDRRYRASDDEQRHQPKRDPVRQPAVPQQAQWLAPFVFFSCTSE
jgi:hypothetical protein